MQDPPVKDRYRCQPSDLYSHSARYSSRANYEFPDYPYPRQLSESSAAHSRSMSMGQNRYQSFNKEPQANLDTHIDDDKAGRSGTTTSEDVPVRSKPISLLSQSWNFDLYLFPISQ